MHWLAFGTYDTRSHPRVAVLLEGIRAGGDTLDEVNVPLGLQTVQRVELLRRPWRLPQLIGRLASAWVRLSVRGRATARRTRPDAVLVGYLGHFDIWLAKVLFRDTPIVLDHLVSAAGTAQDRGLASHGGVKMRLLRYLDRAALARADVIIVDTSERAADLPEGARERAVVVPVGATHEWFDLGRRVLEHPEQPSHHGPVRVVFVGLFTPLHGSRTIGEALALLAGDEDIEVTMVGTGQDYAACRAAAASNPRVTWLGWVTADVLPGLVAGHDISLGIVGTTEKAREVVPTKVFQAAAAGCAVITSDTAPQRRALGDAAVYVPAGDATALAQAVRRLAQDPARLHRVRRAAATHAAEHHTPLAVTAPLRTAMAALLPRSRAAR